MFIARYAAVTITVDGSPLQHVLLRFDDIFGNGAGQIPLGATIQSATLTVNVTNASANAAAFHRMLQGWSATSNWDSLVGGVQANGTEAVTTPDLSSSSSATGPHTVSVASSLAAWSAGGTNLGWALLPGGTLTGLAKRGLPGVKTVALKTPHNLDAAREVLK